MRAGIRAGTYMYPPGSRFFIARIRACISTAVSLYLYGYVRVSVRLYSCIRTDTTMYLRRNKNVSIRMLEGGYGTYLIVRFFDLPKSDI